MQAAPKRRLPRSVEGCWRAKRQEYRSSHGFFREKRCKKSGLVFGTEPKRAFRARFFYFA